MSSEELNRKLQMQKLQLSISKARTAKEEIECKILERQVDIERLKEHAQLQDEVIEKSSAELAALQD